MKRASATGSSRSVKTIQECLKSAGFKPVPRLSHGDPSAPNVILEAENLMALKKLFPRLQESVRCIYIDPPYNNGERYEHYNDDIDHTVWLEQIVDRITLLAGFLTETGSIWISIDDNEVHYLKVAVDEVFGRENFITTLVWQQRRTRENRKVFSNNHEYILVYAKDVSSFTKARNPLPLTPEVRGRYKNPDNDARGEWQSVSANVQAGHATDGQFYEIIGPSGRRYFPPKGRCWVYNEARMKEEIARNNVWFGHDGDRVPRLKRFLADVNPGLTPETLWTAVDVGTTSDAKKHLLQLFPKETVFDTPKPERLIQRILKIATDPGDLVLDAYVGSGTTLAVAHKMGRHYIGVEEGKHAATHCAARLKRVTEGESGGISLEVGWGGGGGFNYYR
jgi:adenine-specific DNA-methyltransferase